MCNSFLTLFSSVANSDNNNDDNDDLIIMMMMMTMTTMMIPRLETARIPWKATSALTVPNFFSTSTTISQAPALPSLMRLCSDNDDNDDGDDDDDDRLKILQHP